MKCTATIKVLVVCSLMSLCPVAYATQGPLLIDRTTTLAEDHRGTITIGADNITLNCAGHKVTGQGSSVRNSNNGINIVRRSGVIVMNCVIAEFYVGIFVFQSDNNTVTHNTVENNRNGVEVESSSQNTFTHNSVIRNQHDGFNMELANSNYVYLNQVDYNMNDGFDLDTCHRNVIAQNLVRLNAGNGIKVDLSSTSNLFQANEVSLNTSHGISLDVSEKNNFLYNIVTANKKEGIIFDSQSNENIVMFNYARNNREGDMHLRGSGGNVFHENDFETHNVICSLSAICF